MTNKDIMQVALEQSAVDMNCLPDDFLKDTNTVTRSRPHEKARRYIPLPLECDLVTYGGGIVAQVSDRCEKAVTDFISRYPAEHCFETPNMRALDNVLRPLGLGVCFMAEYFLPDMNFLKPFNCRYETKVLTQSDFAELYKPEWSNALCEKRRELDVIGVGAYDKGRLIALAGASADCETMYQIGIDVLPGYRRQGIASALTSRLALQIISLGKVPFYCAAWSNIKSVRNALRSGFRPAWVELTAREIGFINEMNNI